MDILFGTENHLSIPQECARAILIFFYGLVMLRISGKRTFARWSALDLVISIVIGSNLARVVTGNAPLPGTLAAVAVMVALHFICSYATAHSAWWSRLLEGGGSILARDGKLDERERQRSLISLEDLRDALRQGGVEKIEDTRLVTLEASGKITILPRTDAKTALEAIAKRLDERGAGG